jgi:hypothetical protein
MTAARAHVVRICVDAPGERVTVAFVVTTETSYEVHDIILKALDGRRIGCGGYEQGQEIDTHRVLDFLSAPFNVGMPRMTVQEIDALGLTVQEIAEAFNAGDLAHLSEDEVAELTTKASAREFASLTATKG